MVTGNLPKLLNPQLNPTTQHSPPSSPVLVALSLWFMYGVLVEKKRKKHVGGALLFPVGVPLFSPLRRGPPGPHHTKGVLCVVWYSNRKEQH